MAPDPDPDPDPGVDPAPDPDPAPEVGVGAWPGRWPTDPRYDPELLATGDRRNVVDGYRYWTVAAIRADLSTRRHPLHVAIENVLQDNNIGSVVRTANAANVGGVHVVGRRRWNRRGAMVTDRYLDVEHHRDLPRLLARSVELGLQVVAVDNTPDAEPIEHAVLPRHCLLVFGQEGPGVSAQARELAGRTVSITQHGSTRSVNVGVAAGIAVHTWLRQHVQPASA